MAITTPRQGLPALGMSGKPYAYLPSKHVLLPLGMTSCHSGTPSALPAAPALTPVPCPGVTSTTELISLSTSSATLLLLALGSACPCPGLPLSPPSGSLLLLTLWDTCLYFGRPSASSSAILLLLTLGSPFQCSGLPTTPYVLLEALPYTFPYDLPLSRLNTCRLMGPDSEDASRWIKTEGLRR